MQPLDWILTGLPLLVVVIVGIYTHHYMKSVVDFLSGGRAARRYLLNISSGELLAGAAVFAAYFEQLAHGGFSMGWWGAIGAPVSLILTIFGFVGYRLRETRALTLAQFFEIRYSKAFRLTTGPLAFFAGILNFGIIPSIGARFVVYFCHLPQSLTLFSFTLPTYIPLMAFFISVALFVTLSGGLITLMMINCIEGIFSQLFYLIIIVALLCMFNWSQISEVLSAQPNGYQPEGKSLMNPFDSSGVKDFNIWFVLMGIFLYQVYGRGAWQNAGAYFGAALTPHEGRMGGILGNWREVGKISVISLMAICSLTFVTHPSFAHQAEPVTAAVNQISDPHMQNQMRMPIALSYLLPVGVKGLFCAILLMGIFGGDATHMQSWGSIFVQDILVPLRKTPFGPREHIRMLRFSIVGVAIFAFIFGCIVRNTQYILMYWALTTAVFVSGAGAAIIGGLYWKKGTTAGAFAALATGSTLAVTSILAEQIHGYHLGSYLKQHYIDPMGPWSNGFASAGNLLANSYYFINSYNGTQISFFVSLIAVTVYVVVSLLTFKEDFNMERMLHRGQYAVAEEGKAEPLVKKKLTLGNLIGIDENFTTGDKWIAGTFFGWGIFWFCVFLVITTWNLLWPWQNSSWSTYWHIVGVGIPVLICFVTGIWFTWGGIRDVRAFFRKVGQEKVNHLDDGTVVNHQNLDEAVKRTESAPKDGPVPPKH